MLITINIDISLIINIIISINYYAIALMIFINDIVRSAVNKMSRTLPSITFFWTRLMMRQSRISENIQQPWRIYFLRTNHLHVYCICRSWKEGICFHDDVKRPIEQFVRLHRSHRFFLPADFSCQKYFLCKCRSFRNSMIEESNTLLRYISYAKMPYLGTLYP